MNSEQIPAEAVEAAARAMYPEEFEHPRTYADSCDHARHQATAALTAALPHLANHQPARVQPSVEDVARTLCEPRHRDPDQWPLVGVKDYCGRCLDQAEAVLALFASQPTVQEVRAEALRDAARDLEDQLSDSGPGNRSTGYGLAGLDIIRRLRARAAETAEA